MQVKDIIEELKEGTGRCALAETLLRTTRACELLANEGLFDAQIGYVNILVGNDYHVALPRDVKTILKLNINGQPTFTRSRLFEFTLNTEGSVDGEEIGYSHSDRGYTCIQDETHLPGRMSYLCSNSDDAGKGITVEGTDEAGRVISERVLAALVPAQGSKIFYSVTQVVRDATTADCMLLCEGETIGQYYATETHPSYRVIKLSKKAVTVRIMYRRHVFKLASLDDVVPVNSALAIIHATKAVRYYAADEYENAEKAIALAVSLAKKEQESRQEHVSMALTMEVTSATNHNISVRDSIIVADIYDCAADIFGPVGRAKLFDKITTAIEILSNKTSWDSKVGMVDIWKSSTSEEVGTYGRKGNAYFVLPRFVESIISLNWCGSPMTPRNQWYEFHLNGHGESGGASCGTWDDAGEVVVINQFPYSETTKRIIPSQVVAVPDTDADDDALIEIFGYEMQDDEEVEVWREGKRGWRCPCALNSLDPGLEAPYFTRIERITRDATVGFVSLFLVELKTASLPFSRLGYWYPDEIEPKYRRIKLQASGAVRLRAMYRKRTHKVTSLQDPIPLRSRHAIETMMQAMKAIKDGDPQGAKSLEEIAVIYLSEERINASPSETVSLQFDTGGMPGFTGNIQ